MKLVKECPRCFNDTMCMQIGWKYITYRCDDCEITETTHIKTSPQNIFEFLQGWCKAHGYKTPAAAALKGPKMLKKAVSQAQRQFEKLNSGK